MGIKHWAAIVARGSEGVDFTSDHETTDFNIDKARGTFVLLFSMIVMLVWAIQVEVGKVR